jgi:hypothetical protein
MFAERPFTTGKGKLNVGAAFQHTTFSSVGGRSLTDLESSIVYENGDIYRGTSSLDVQLDRTIVSATYGLHTKSTSRRLCPLAALVSRVCPSLPVAVRRPRKSSVPSAAARRSASETSWFERRLRSSRATSFDAAAAVDIRLPTGDPEKLLGTGFTQARVMFIGGTTFGSVNPHSTSATPSAARG